MSYEAFKEQCINTWKDIEDNLPPMYQMGEDAHDAVIKYGVEFVEAIRKLPLPEVKQEPIEINWPDYHYQAMGCGLEDCGIRDKYDAMRYGWDCAVERCIEAVGDDPLYLATPDAEALRKENEQLRELLDDTMTGLLWYHNAYPETMADIDYEIIERINDALKGGAT